MGQPDGGGYSYRLCKADQELTEECFQKTPLPWAGDFQYVQYGTDTSDRSEFVANRTSEGTMPEGSVWTKNPIPACNTTDGGAWLAPGFDWGEVAPQFTPPLPGLYGYGSNTETTRVMPPVSEFNFW